MAMAQSSNVEFFLVASDLSKARNRQRACSYSRLDVELRAATIASEASEIA